MFTREPVSPCSGILYADHLVTITGESITFVYYSFPFAGSRTVAFSDIDHIMVMEPSLINGKWRIWGSGTCAPGSRLISTGPRETGYF